MDLLSLVRQMQVDGSLATLVGNPLSQFGPPNKRYVGATLLPERLVSSNAFTETQIRYRTVIANDGSRYSPAQLKSSGQIVGEFQVWLGNQDIAQKMEPQDYEAIGLLLNRNLDANAANTAIGWFDKVIVQALIELEEKQRWNAIVNAAVVRSGDNGFTETVTYSNPAGHRVAAGGTWSLDTYDPFDDIYAMADLLSDKGYTLNRIIAPRAVTTIMARNDQVAKRAGNVRVLSTSDVFGRVSLAEINSYLGADGLPAIETYDLQYQTQDGVMARFLPAGTMIFAATTGRDETVEFGETSMYLPDTLGYTALGVAVGRTAPGRAFFLDQKEDKPPRLEAQGWQSSLPVLTQPEAFAVVSGIA